jgi:hypothetical protein
MDSSCCYREQVAYALYSTFREPKLYRMAANGNWDLIPARCCSHPKEVAFVHKYAPNDTVLHRLLRPSSCTNQQPHHSVKQEKDQSVDVATIIDEESSVLQHEIDQMKLAAAAALLDTDPEIATRPDAFGRTPLHLVCSDAHFSDINQAICQLLLPTASHPSAAHAMLLAKDVEGRTPVHALLLRTSPSQSPIELPLDLLQQMVTICPEAVQVKDVVRETPLDIAIRRSEEILHSDRVVQLLRESCPESSYDPQQRTRRHGVTLVSKS